MLNYSMTVTILAILLAGCGQRGALYLPQDKTVPATTSSAPASPPAGDSKK